MIEDAARAYREVLGQRIETVVREHFPTKSAAAIAAGISVEQLNKWIRGTVKVPTDGLYSLSRAADVDFSWLVSGDGHARRNRSDIAAAVLEGMKIINGVMTRIFQEEGVRIPPVNVVEEVTGHATALIARLDDPTDLDELHSLIPWLENRIRKSLKQPGSGKREAS